jgi:glycosyltransferase involved in cell wall biosynthesis
VITTDAEGCAEVVGTAGIVVEKGNVRDIRGALNTLMSDPAQVELLAQRGRDRAQFFRWPRIAALYLGVFNAALGRAANDKAHPTRRDPQAPAQCQGRIDLKRP